MQEYGRFFQNQRKKSAKRNVHASGEFQYIHLLYI